MDKAEALNLGVSVATLSLLVVFLEWVGESCLCLVVAFEVAKLAGRVMRRAMNNIC